MFNVIRAELRKLRRPTLFLGTMGAVVFFSGLFSALLYLLIDSPQGNADRGRVISREVLALASGGVQGFANVGGFLGIIALCVFAAQTAQGIHIRHASQLISSPAKPNEDFVWKIDIDDHFCLSHDHHICNCKYWDFGDFGTDN